MRPIKVRRGEVTTTKGTADIMERQGIYTILGAVIAASTAFALKGLDIAKWIIDIRAERLKSHAAKLYEIYSNCIYYCSGVPDHDPTALALVDRRMFPQKQRSNIGIALPGIISRKPNGLVY
jgi:hypothetical protein